MKSTSEIRILFILLILLLAASCFHAKSKSNAQEPISATVTKVVDDDTLKIKHDGQEEIVRLIGTGTPESKANTEKQKPPVWWKFWDYWEFWKPWTELGLFVATFFTAIAA